MNFGAVIQSHENSVAAASLNNMGVSLIELGSFHEAANTFTDAISLMKAVHGGANAPAKEGAGTSPPDAALLLLKAEQRLSQVSETCSEGETTPTPMRVDVDNNEPDLDSAVMLFNIGLCHLRLSESGKSSLQRASASMLFKLADVILVRRMSALEHGDALFNRSLTVAVSVLRVRFKVLADLGESGDAEDVYNRLSVLETMQNLLQGDSEKAAAAVA